MPNEKAQKIIKEALANRDVYDEMAKKEANVWSNFFSSPEQERVREAEQQASLELRPARHQLRLPMILRKHGISPRAGLSLGCGSGRAERNFLKQRICESFHGIDIAADAIATAVEAAAKEGLNCTYELQDLNDLKLPAQSYDLIVAQTSLHHVLRLEHTLDEVAKALTPDGHFWVHDYIGESQFQFTDERLQIMNDLLAILPEKLTYSHFSKTQIKRVNRREPGTLISPFESIRSGEIRELLLERFDVIETREEESFLHRVAGIGMKQNFVANDDTKTIVELLLYFDNLLVEKNILTPTVGQYLLKAKSPR